MYNHRSTLCIWIFSKQRNQIKKGTKYLLKGKQTQKHDIRVTRAYSIHRKHVLKQISWCSSLLISRRRLMLTPWIQVNFNAIVYITGLTTQGYYYGVSLVETYTAKYGNSSSFLSFVSTSSGSVQMVSTVLVGHVFHCPPTTYSHLLTTGLSPVLLREYGTTSRYASEIVTLFHCSNIHTQTYLYQM